MLREPEGGLNTYRSRFARERADPHAHHGRQPDRRGGALRRHRDRPDTPRAADGLRILLVGELAYNADRVLALEERGHQLFGLWMPDPYWYNSVGPLPVRARDGPARGLSPQGWRDAVRDAGIDVDLRAAQLAGGAVRGVGAAGRRGGVPFVWHYKEGPVHLAASGATGATSPS